MGTLQILKQTEHFARMHLSKDITGGHDWLHIERVLNNAKLICKSEKAEWFIVALGVMLHDVGDYKITGTIEDDYSIAENFLISQKLDNNTLEQVVYIIKNISFRSSFEKKKVSQPIEFQIVQDSDRLDAMGAIGIARAFAYGGSKSRAIYNPLIKLNSVKSKKDYKTLETSSLHHFYEKLFLLKDLMNTKTAKRIALRRHTYMQKFVEQFLHEWKGEL